MKSGINWLIAPVIVLHAKSEENSNLGELELREGKLLSVSRFEFLVGLNLLFIPACSTFSHIGWLVPSFMISVMSFIFTILYIFLYFKAAFDKRENTHLNLLVLQVLSCFLVMLPLIAFMVPFSMLIFRYA